MLSEFELWLFASGRRPVPIERILLTIRQYLAHCHDHGPFVRESTLSYLAASAHRVKRITLRNRHDHLNVFFKWALAEGKIHTSPLSGIPRPRVSPEEASRDEAPITPTMLTQLLAACDNDRDRALLLVLWDTPLRAAEICGLRRSDIEEDELKVRDGKGGCRYEAIITARTLRVINRYIDNRSDSSAWLFLSQRGDKLTARALGLLLRRLSRRAGTTVHPHQFRHNWRLRMRDMGLSDAEISACMGHRTIQATWGYARRAVRQVAKERLRERMG